MQEETARNCPVGILLLFMMTPASQRTSHTAHLLYRTTKNNSPLYIASALYAQCAVVLVR